MLVKIGDLYFDSNKQPIMCVLSEADKVNIAHMKKKCFRYAAVPDNVDGDWLKEWMQLDTERTKLASAGHTVSDEYSWTITSEQECYDVYRGETKVASFYHIDEVPLFIAGRKAFTEYKSKDAVDDLFEEND